MKFMKDNWRLLDTGKLTGAENMALDDTILECKSERKIPNTLRFLQFEPACVLVGYHQSVEQEVRVDYCSANNIDINRRITGGGTILFTPKSLGWEVVADKSSTAVRDLRNDLDRLARLICNGAISGLRRLGVEAKFRPKNDIEIEGRKISGTGGTERGDSIMYQGTLLVDFDIEMMLKSLRIPVEKLADKEIDSVKKRVTDLKEQLGQVPPIRDIKEAFVAGFEEVLGVSTEADGLHPEEKSLYRKKLPSIKSKKWVYSIRQPLDTSGKLSAMWKTPGGLLRVSIATDILANFIQSIFITGDFQVFPQRAIMDLEARLKNTPTDRNMIRNTVLEFFRESGARVIGIEPQDFVDIILEATEKTIFLDYGFSLADADKLLVVNFAPEELDKQTFDFVLLPYCAKLVGCDYRFREGCSMCGQCSVGPVYETIEELGIPVRTIQSFEDLIETIDEFDTKGSRGYIGSCCDAFYSKHYDDFVETGVPALLVDVDDSTCYELGEEEDAYAGSFEGQTQLKEDLLIRVIRTMWKENILRADGE